MREIDNEARIAKEAEIKRKFNRNQKCITPWDIQLSSVIFLLQQMSSHRGSQELFMDLCFMNYSLPSLVFTSFLTQWNYHIIENL